VPHFEERQNSSEVPEEKPSKPLILASESIREELLPWRPGAKRIQVLLVGFGFLLIAILFVPWGYTKGWVMGFEYLGNLLGDNLVMNLYIPFSGFLFIGLGAASIPYIFRALATFILSLIPLFISALGYGELLPHEEKWRSILFMWILVCLPAALILRANYKASILARILVAIGVMGAIIHHFLPIYGRSFATTILSGLNNPGQFHLLFLLWYIMFIVISLLGLLAFMGYESTGFCNLWAGLLILWTPSYFFIDGITRLIYQSPLEFKKFIIGIQSFVYIYLAAYGLAQLLSILCTLKVKK
jgi:hypothetical protein